MTTTMTCVGLKALAVPLQHIAVSRIPVSTTRSREEYTEIVTYFASSPAKHKHTQPLGAPFLPLVEITFAVVGF